MLHLVPPLSIHGTAARSPAPCSRPLSLPLPPHYATSGPGAGSSMRISHAPRAPSPRCFFLSDGGSRLFACTLYVSSGEQGGSRTACRPASVSVPLAERLNRQRARACFLSSLRVASGRGEDQIRGIGLWRNSPKRGTALQGGRRDAKSALLICPTPSPVSGPPLRCAAPLRCHQFPIIPCRPPHSSATRACRLPPSLRDLMHTRPLHRSRHAFLACSTALCVWRESALHVDSGAWL